MVSLFQGAPQSATSYTESTTETPRWMQDAIFNQIQISQNLANRPFESYDLPTIAQLSPLQQQAYQQVQTAQGAYQPDLDASAAGIRALAGLSPLEGTDPNIIPTNTQTGLGAAQNYFTKAAEDTPTNVMNYYNPYQQQVMDQLAKQGARNLQENLLPAVSDSFIRAGQFGSSRMGDFGSRAVRDTQEAILAQQAELANTGYAQAMANRATDLTRQANLGQTVAGIQQSDVARQMGALSDLANLGAQRQALGYTDTAALEAAGAGQQQQMQRELTAAEKQFLDQQNFARDQADFLSSQIRGLAPVAPKRTTSMGQSQGQTYSPSPLSQIAAGLATYKGLQNLAGNTN
jgi:hypothetical protein